jgi:hypothetical protein
MSGDAVGCFTGLFGGLRSVKLGTRLAPVEASKAPGCPSKSRPMATLDADAPVSI